MDSMIDIGGSFSRVGLIQGEHPYQPLHGCDDNTYSSNDNVVSFLKQKHRHYRGSKFQPQLGNWLNLQRLHYRRENLKIERYHKWLTLDLSWKPQSLEMTTHPLKIASWSSENIVMSIKIFVFRIITRVDKARTWVHGYNASAMHTNGVSKILLAWALRKLPRFSWVHTN